MLLYAAVFIFLPRDCSLGCIMHGSCCHAMSGWVVFVTFVYCVETAKDTVSCYANRKLYRIFRMLPFPVTLSDP